MLRTGSRECQATNNTARVCLNGAPRWGGPSPFPTFPDSTVVPLTATISSHTLVLTIRNWLALSGV